MVKGIGIAAACLALASAGAVSFGEFSRTNSTFEIAEGGSLRGSIEFDAKSASGFVAIPDLVDQMTTASIKPDRKGDPAKERGFAILGGIDEALHTGPISGFNYIIDDFALTTGGIDESLYEAIDTTLTGSIQPKAPKPFKRTYWERFDRYGNPID